MTDLDKQIAKAHKLLNKREIQKHKKRGGRRSAENDAPSY